MTNRIYSLSLHGDGLISSVVVVITQFQYANAVTPVENIIAKSIVSRLIDKVQRS